MVLLGIVIYISTFKAEVGNKLRPKSSFQGPMFDYTYGYSFMFAVASLILCELAGTFAIFLYIRQYQLEWKKEAENQQYIPACQIEYLPAPVAPPIDPTIYCKRHGRGRRYSRTQVFSRDASPCPPSLKTSRHDSLTVPTGLPLSESMRDLTYYNIPPFSRETTCNTVSTAVDLNRDFYRDLSPRREVYSSIREREYSPRLFTYGQQETIFSYDPPMRRITPV